MEVLNEPFSSTEIVGFLIVRSEGVPFEVSNIEAIFLDIVSELLYTCFGPSFSPS